MEAKHDDLLKLYKSENRYFISKWINSLPPNFIIILRNQVKRIENLGKVQVLWSTILPSFTDRTKYIILCATLPARSPPYPATLINQILLSFIFYPKVNNQLVSNYRSTS